MSIKLYIGSEIRRLNLNETKSFSDLVKKVESYKPNTLTIFKYLDVDSDWVTFSTEEEWQEAIKNFHKDGFKIKLVSEGQDDRRHHGHHHGHHERQEQCQRKQESQPEPEKKRCGRFQQQGHCPRFQQQGPHHGFPQCLNDLFGSGQKQGLNDLVGQIGEFGKQLLGGQNLNDLQELFKPQTKESGEIVHSNVICDGCNVTPIKGDRYRCNELKDFDLCGKCFEGQKFKDLTHTFTKIAHPIGSRGFWNDFIREIQKEAEKYSTQDVQKKEESKDEIIEIKEEFKPELVVEDIPLTRDEPKVVEFTEQLELLRSMGFTNDEQSLVALKKWKGQIQRVVSELLNQ
jgi:hypothetical protein